MPGIKNWIKQTDERRMVRYSNTENRAIGIAFSPADADGDWVASIIVSDYPIARRTQFGSKRDAKSWLVEKLRRNPEPELACENCGFTINWAERNAADMAKQQRYFDCPDCGYEAPSEIVYGYEST